MILPINNHVLIEPLKHDSFISSQRDSFEEIGVVIDCPVIDVDSSVSLEKGDTVYFDSWLAVKYPKGDDGDFFWLVKFDDIRAVEKNGKE